MTTELEWKHEVITQKEQRAATLSNIQTEIWSLGTLLETVKNLYLAWKNSKSIKRHKNNFGSILEAGIHALFEWIYHFFKKKKLIFTCQNIEV